MISGEKSKIQGDLNKIKHLDELKKWLESLEIPISDVCLSGSAILAYYGIRENNDLEIILDCKAKKKLIHNELKKTGYWGHIAVTEHVDFFNNQYSVVGYSDKYIFSHKCYIECNGMKIVSIGYEYLYKQFLLKYLHQREKDVNDIIMIESGFFNVDDLPNNRYKDKASGFWYWLLGIHIHLLCIWIRKRYNKICAYIPTVLYWIKKITRNIKNSCFNDIFKDD